MLDILKSEGNFVIKFVALTLKLYLCIAIISKGLRRSWSKSHTQALKIWC